MDWFRNLLCPFPDARCDARGGSLRILKDVNEKGEYVLSVQKNPTGDIKIIGIFEAWEQMNEHYETIKVTLKALNKKVTIIDNI